MNPTAQIITGVTLWLLVPAAIFVAASRAVSAHRPKNFKPPAPRPTTEDPWGLTSLPAPQEPYHTPGAKLSPTPCRTDVEAKPMTRHVPITRPQDSITALCAYRKGFEDALSLLGAEQDEERRAEESGMISKAIERKLRTRFHSAEDGESRRIAARALSPVIAEIMGDLSKRAKALEALKPLEKPE